MVPLVGTPKQRLAALNRPADINVCSFENAKWLVDQKVIKHDMVVFDELSRLSNAQGKRYRAIWSILPYMRKRVGLTASPATNGYMKLYGQFKIIDFGARLFKTIGKFRSRYFDKVPGVEWDQFVIRKESAAEIEHKIADITLSLIHI